MQKEKRTLIPLAMINVAAVLSLRDCPSMAEHGWSSVGWYVIGTLTFFIPLSLAGAELATGWPKGGGVYSWVKEAFGDHSGFIAVFCEWSNNLVWFPAVLSFMASTLAFAVDPQLANNNIFMFTVMLAIFWGTTIAALFGERVAGHVRNIGVALGSIVPGILIVVLGITYLLEGRSLAVPPFSADQLVPTLNLGTLPFVATVVLLCAGMEMVGYYASSVPNPQKDYPRAMALSATIIFVLTVSGNLAIAFVVPQKELSLAAGVMQAFAAFFEAFNLNWLVGPLALLVTIGGVALLMSWLNGPAKGLRVVAEQGNMPRMFGKLNRYGAPVSVLVLQGLIGTIISALFLFMPSVSAAYWILSAMTTEVLCITYMFIFASVIKLRYSQPEVPRAYRIPGRKVGIWIVAGTGFASCLFTFIASLFPPSGIETISPEIYMISMIVGTAILVMPPLAFMKFKKASVGRRKARPPVPMAHTPLTGLFELN